MEQPDGFKAPDKDDWVMKPMAIEDFGFKQPLRMVWYHRGSQSDTTIFVVYAGDIISASSLLSGNQRFKQQLREHWDMSDLGPVKHA